MKGVVAQLTVKPGTEDQFKAAFLELRKAVHENEPDNVLYDVFQSSKDSNVFFVQEQYKDQAAIDAHNSAPYFAEAIGKFGDLLAEAPVIHMMDKVE